MFWIFKPLPELVIENKEKEYFLFFHFLKTRFFVKFE